MRGRTNITQRTGPSVIGNLVTRKQVTGATINPGDFVEFTGSTSVWEVLLGSLNYQMQEFFDISDTVKGCVFINPTSSQVKFVIFDDDGILKESSLNSISFNSDYTFLINYDRANNKIYMAQRINSSSWDHNLYTFNVAQDYTVTYGSLVTAVAPTVSYSAVKVLACVRNSYIYWVARPTVSSTVFYIYKYNLDGTTIEDTITYTFPSSVAFNGTWNVLVDDEVILVLSISDDSSYRITYVFSDNEIYATRGESSNDYLRYTNRSRLGKVVSVGGYNFLIGFQGNDDANHTLSVFYYDANGDMKVVAKKGYDASNYVNDHELLVEKSGDDYRILFAVSGSEYASNKRILLALFNFNSVSGELVQLNVKTITSALEIYYFKKCKIVNYDGVYNLFFAGSGTSTNNRVARTKFVITNNTIVQAESLDLVKKYSSHIDGVAKVGGSAGQEISVYIP